MSIETLAPFLAPAYENFPKSRVIGLVVLRTTLSETIFRTEGTGEPMCREFVQAGLTDDRVVERLVMTKRKQIAPERRRGREFLRAYELLYKKKEDESVCSLNTNAPCEMCIDCFLYGFAAGGGGAQKSRIWTEDAFSLLPANDLLGDRTINGVYENGTMRLRRDDDTEKASTSLNTSEYIKPGVHFLDVVTLKDVTADELRYVLGNILLTSRYGAISSRVGRMENQILGVFGGIAELPSSLELIQTVHDVMRTREELLEHPLKREALTTTVEQVIENWATRRGVAVKLSKDEVEALIVDVDRHWSLDEQETFLKRLNQSYETFRQVPATDTKKTKSKNKKPDAVETGS
ncbi:type I-D CRISPR-associated protein Cas7/Csc2 [Leptolyngbya sp. FACHB-17]|uniref:type I-D CRISPR-associated protein Cas7/Csc2 n=1 Tax=unclassified Leptolyngbya TaxID=2650499 RepID=UPI0016806C89|nr:type I-D CRISPR-associated protein Cas7/Csc2 [Leptolyngbya sp. FACHB-17]MBD2083355.1 type I-D CRISPR-associated protein Cas7/Csc2 [Leptolyngbya sp. FACHB-17]